LQNLTNKNCTVVLPTYFPGDEIFDNIKSIPKNIKILVVDNSFDDRLLHKISKFSNCVYFNIGDVGLGKTFNFALEKIETDYMLLTQPDVVLRENCLSNLILGMQKYPTAGMVVPIVYDLGNYSQYDFYDLKYSKKNKKFNQDKLKNKINIEPVGDFCVDAVNATTMLIRTEVMKKIGGWDSKIYVYLEDIDICLRLHLNSYSVVKIKNAVVDHKGWSSHFSEIKDTMNVTRVWHFAWSSMYFNFKFCNKFIALSYLFKMILKSFVKLLFSLITANKEKYKINRTRLSACQSIIFNKGSYFRIKHKVD
jgi:N-acetylglucosaminyl-diphospho-decaprenol L-rhamnosyltransferase